jgi:hypothetical protein
LAQQRRRSADPSAPKLIGYWATPGESECHWPDIRRAVDTQWPAAKRQQIVAYLRSGHRCRGYLGSSGCRFSCREKFGLLGSGELTDGEWIWPEGLPHYVQRHGVVLPEEFVASASARGWEVPPVDQVRASMPMAYYCSAPPSEQMDFLKSNPAAANFKLDYSVWCEWGSRLIYYPKSETVPDPGVMRRFCLTIQHPEADEPGPRWWEFDELVLDKMRDEYGQFEHGFGNSYLDIEWISVEHRASVVAKIVGGLRQYGFIDRAQLICSEPDPDDWHHDREFVLWPRNRAAESAV